MWGCWACRTEPGDGTQLGYGDGIWGCWEDWGWGWDIMGIWGWDLGVLGLQGRILP